MKILYVDDEQMNIQLFEYNFKKKFEVVSGACGEEGLKCLEDHPDIKVVISDMKMPRMTGLEFIAKAKAKFKDKKYFILTGYDITQDIQEAIKSHLILKYFKKPFNMKEIEQAILEVV